MKISDISNKISAGEDSFTQFKEQLIKAKELAKEFVAFSNSGGGVIIFGVSDQGEIKGLTSKNVEELGQLIGNVANENIKPPIYPITQNMSIDDKRIVVASIVTGDNKPYSTSSGEYYTKSSSDKKRISPEELRRMFAESKRLYADEAAVYKTTINDLNTQLFYQYLENSDPKIYTELKDNLLDFSTLLHNEGILTENQLSLSGNLIFGINPQRFTPSFYIDCVYFIGKDVTSQEFLSEYRFKGAFKELFNQSLNFLKSNLRRRQVEESFNSLGKLEINELILEELIINALIHRDYYIDSPIRIFMFDDRVEIISPGKLTNSLTIENIKSGRSIHRNPILDSIAKYVLNYSGRGSGIKRVLSLNPDIEFVNDIENDEFKCIIPRVIS